MRKEVIIAILIGLVMGLFITYGFYHSQKTIDPSQLTTIAEFDDQEPETTLKNGKLTIFSPEDETIQAESSIKVAGSTLPNSYIVIYVNNAPYITQADETGNFSRELTLDPLANIITVHAIDESGEINTTQRSLVVYDQEITLQEQQAEDDSKETQDD
ncbi:MAG: hypothetical protein XD95_0623 [Microgenomates bacterium 39_7]|nr:MAG: hypothetical protein XD95_0623 [Microgenomates bacterium 39_7]